VGVAGGARGGRAVQAGALVDGTAVAQRSKRGVGVSAVGAGEDLVQLAVQLAQLVVQTVAAAAAGLDVEIAGGFDERALLGKRARAVAVLELELSSGRASQERGEEQLSYEACSFRTLVQ
jgi:hypothetical protein